MAATTSGRAVRRPVGDKRPNTPRDGGGEKRPYARRAGGVGGWAGNGLRAAGGRTRDDRPFSAGPSRDGAIGRVVKVRFKFGGTRNSRPVARLIAALARPPAAARIAVAARIAEALGEARRVRVIMRRDFAVVALYSFACRASTAARRWPARCGGGERSWFFAAEIVRCDASEFRPSARGPRATVRIRLSRDRSRWPHRLAGASALRSCDQAVRAATTRTTASLCQASGLRRPRRLSRARARCRQARAAAAASKKNPASASPRWLRAPACLAPRCRGMDHAGPRCGEWPRDQFAGARCHRRRRHHRGLQAVAGTRAHASVHVRQAARPDDDPCRRKGGRRCSSICWKTFRG